MCATGRCWRSRFSEASGCRIIMQRLLSHAFLVSSVHRLLFENDDGSNG